MGISGKFLASLQSLHKNVKCTVRVNGQQTDWINVNCGLKCHIISFVLLEIEVKLVNHVQQMYLRR